MTIDHRRERENSETAVCLTDVLSAVDRKRRDVNQTLIPISTFRPQGDLFNIDQACRSTKTQVSSNVTYNKPPQMTPSPSCY